MVFKFISRINRHYCKERLRTVKKGKELLYRKPKSCSMFITHRFSKNTLSFRPFLEGFKLFSHYAIRSWPLPLLLLFSLFIASCTGDGDDDDDDAPELLLSSLEVTGYTLEFDQNQFGPYEIEVGSDVETIEIIAIKERADVELSYSQSSDGTTGTFDIEDSGVFHPELEDGTNIISIQLEDPDEDETASYILDIQKISSSATIQRYELFDFSIGGDNTSIELTPSFEELIFDYRATLRYRACAYSYQIQPNLEETVVTIDGEEIDTDIVNYRNIEVGENIIETIVTSEDGSETDRYSISLVREEPTDEELDQDSTIEDLRLDPSPRILSMCAVSMNTARSSTIT